MAPKMPIWLSFPGSSLPWGIFDGGFLDGFVPRGAAAPLFWASSPGCGVFWPRLPQSRGKKPRMGSWGRFPTCLGVPIDSCQIRSDGESACKCEQDPPGLPGLSIPSALALLSCGLQRFLGSGELESASRSSKCPPRAFPRDWTKTLRKQQHFPKELIKSIKLFTSGLHQSCFIWGYNRKATSLKSKRRRRFPGLGTDL